MGDNTVTSSTVNQTLPFVVHPDLVQRYLTNCRLHGVKKPNSLVLTQLGQCKDEPCQVVVNTYLGNKGTFVLLKTLAEHRESSVEVISLSGVGLDYKENSATAVVDPFFLKSLQLLFRFSTLRSLDLSYNYLTAGSEKGSQLVRHILLELIEERRSIQFLPLSNTGLPDSFVYKVHQILHQRRKRSTVLVEPDRELEPLYSSEKEEGDNVDPPVCVSSIMKGSTHSLRSTSRDGSEYPQDAPRKPTSLSPFSPSHLTGARPVSFQQTRGLRVISYTTPLPPLAQKVPLVGYCLLGRSGTLAAVSNTRQRKKQRPSLPPITNHNDETSRDMVFCQEVADWIKSRRADQSDPTHCSPTPPPATTPSPEESKEVLEESQRPLPDWVIHSLVELRRRLVRNRHNLQKVYDLFLLPEEETVKYADGAYDAYRRLPGMLAVQSDAANNFKKDVTVFQQERESPERKVSLDLEPRIQVRNTGVCSWRAFFKGLRQLNVRFASKDLATSTLFASSLGILQCDEVSFGRLFYLLRPHIEVRDSGRGRTPSPQRMSQDSPDVADHARLSLTLDTYISRFTLYGPELSMSAGSVDFMSHLLGSAEKAKLKVSSTSVDRRLSPLPQSRGASFNSYNPLHYTVETSASPVQAQIVRHSTEEFMSTDLQVLLDILYDFRHEIRRKLRLIGKCSAAAETGPDTAQDVTLDDSLRDDLQNYIAISPEPDEAKVGEPSQKRKLSVSYSQLLQTCLEFTTAESKESLEQVLFQCGIPSEEPESVTVDYETRFLRKLKVSHFSTRENKQPSSLLGVLTSHGRGTRLSTVEAVESLDALGTQKERQIWKTVTAAQFQSLLRPDV